MSSRYSTSYSHVLIVIMPLTSPSLDMYFFPIVCLQPRLPFLLFFQPCSTRSNTRLARSLTRWASCLQTSL